LYAALICVLVHFNANAGLRDDDLAIPTPSALKVIEITSRHPPSLPTTRWSMFQGIKSLRELTYTTASRHEPWIASPEGIPAGKLVLAGPSSPNETMKRLKLSRFAQS